MNEGFSLDEIICDDTGKPCDLRYLAVNPAFERQTGLKAADVVGHTTLELFPAAEPVWLERYGKVALTGESESFEEWFMPLGRCFHVSAFQTDPGRFGVMFLDITERKQAEAALNERTQQLEAANKELENFTYSVSHDLKAPLRAIDGFSKMLVKKHGSTLHEDAARMLSVIRGNTDRMNVLIDDLLNFSRVLRGGMAVSKIDMKDLVDEVWNEIRADHADRALEVLIADLIPGFGDRTLIRQVLFNLFSNAVKFTRDRKPGVIDMSSYSEDDCVVYCLKDNGVGFDMAYYGKLFSVFQRLHSLEEYEGTGAGLAIVKRIINRHGGRVWAEAEVDKGAIFRFTLPRKEDSIIAPG
jgi:PAS domain S-box-containing protein